jgi:hypothetical protein
MGILDGPNPDRELNATVDGVVYARHPVRTRLVTRDDRIVDVVKRYAQPLGDDVALVACSERTTAVTQGRSYPVDEIRVGRLARFLWPRVTQTGYGIGLGSPQTMQLAIQEVGAPRILLAAAVAAVTKPFGIHGLFYKVAGRQAAAVDGAADYVIPPYDKEATLGPKDPDGVARAISAAIGKPVAIIDANDAGCATLGVSRGVDPRWVERLFLDNPLGQSLEQTPVCVVRRVEWPADAPLPPVPQRRLIPPGG